MLMGIGTLSTVARYRPRNLVIVVIDNRAYVTTGAMASATASGTGSCRHGARCRDGSGREGRG